MHDTSSNNQPLEERQVQWLEQALRHECGVDLGKPRHDVDSDSDAEENLLVSPVVQTPASGLPLQLVRWGWRTSGPFHLQRWVEIR